MHEKKTLIKKYTNEDNSEYKEIIDGYIFDNVFISNINNNEDCTGACHVNRILFSAQKGLIFGANAFYGNLETIITETEIDNHYNYENICNISIYNVINYNAPLNESIIGEYTLRNNTYSDEHELTIVTNTDNLII